MLSSLDSLFGRVLAVLNFVACAIIMVLTVLICADVIGRGAFNAPLPGVPEIARFSVLVMFWMQMPFTLRAGRHIRSGLYLDRASSRGHAAVEIVNALLGAAVFAVITWWSMPELIRVYRGNDFEGAAPVRIPLWPIWGIFIMGTSLTALQYLIIAARALCGRAPSQLAAASDAELDSTV